MLTEQMKNEMAKACGLEEERRVELIREKVGEKFPHPSDETAIARKSIYLLLSYMAQMHPEIKNTKEYQEAISWYNDIEAIKAKTTAEMNM